MVRTLIGLEHDRRWSAIRTALGSAAIGDVARRFGVTPGSIASALVRTREKRAPVVPATEAASVAPEPDAAAALDVDPVQVQAVAEQLVTEEIPVLAPGGKLDVHIRAYREAAAAGEGAAYLLDLHRLVRSSLRAKIIREGDDTLLATFDGDASAKKGEAERAVEAPSEALRAEAPSGVTETPRPGGRKSVAPPTEPDAPTVPTLAETTTEGVVQAVPHAPRGAVQQPIRDVEPSRGTLAHIFIVSVLVDGIRREYGVVGADMSNALQAVSRAGLLSAVTSVRRTLEALT